MAISDSFNQGDHDAAVHEAIAAVDANPDEPAPYATLATLLTSLGDYDQATELLVKSLGRFPDDEELQYSFGVLAFAQGDAQSAINRLTPLAASKSQLGTDAQYMLGLSYQALGQAPKALAFALTAHDRQPDKVDAALLSANLLLSLGAFSEAEAMLRPFVADNNAQVLFNYGLALNAQDKDGTQYLDQAKALDPKTYNQQFDQLKDISRFLNWRGENDHG
ncbi:tetratricopeptide repeat protein [Lacticaseibacillus brantae]|uniref:TPR repeats containing protein n=1 Tax=Lacticaseibacillus brantae DSM 23927 TaxID=1423727 RepID=A0A0R2AZK5_9LACO|nr:tetratricopeptide repeat protein [Lacticaseibacillus brantae]KRM72528.1 tPR repeats containing protein [Lacticaseibacillus brantae DSM 23927]